MDRISNFLIFLCNYFLPSFCYTKLAYLQVDLRLRSAAFATPGFTTVYENDFSARTSQIPLPDSRWSEATYVADTDLFVNYAAKYSNSDHYRSAANASTQTNHVHAHRDRARLRLLRPEPLHPHVQAPPPPDARPVPPRPLHGMTERASGGSSWFTRRVTAFSPNAVSPGRTPPNGR